MDKRLVIGILVSGIADSFSIQTCRGVMNASRDKGIDIVIFPGKYINRKLVVTQIMCK